MTHLKARNVPPRAQWQLEQQGLHPLLARLYAARGIESKSELDHELNALLPPARLTHAAAAAVLLADAIEAGARILIVADYDCDGATACAVGVRALRAMAGNSGVTVDYLVPNRFSDGYGLSPEIVDRAAREKTPDLLVTVDNGIASLAGVARAAELGIATLITDHHLPGDELPAADCIVNPNQPGCAFPSKCLAGVGVMFYVMLALRAELRARGGFGETTGIREPNLGALLDLVALGTVADVVPLDHNNRTLVEQGLKRMRGGRMNPGIRALFHAAGRDPAKAGGADLGFIVGPRLNAAGRLADMALGIEALITDDEARALNIAQELEQLNRERKNIEVDMQQQALAHLDALDEESEMATSALTLFHPEWHQGVIGLIASRIKDRRHRPVFAFARGDGGELKGSG
ncbi:MAG: DHH family phosphoesterase, partial [Candidatus Accumulibacter sp.]|nr:DHH family phosphoesterase [Accumulibacter sp.]